MLKILIASLLIFSNAKAQVCGTDLFEKSDRDQSLIAELIDSKNDFVVQEFRSESYQTRGCGVACAINVVQSVNLRLGLQPLDKQEIFKLTSASSDKYFYTTSFGYHGASSLVGLNVGTLAEILNTTLGSKFVDVSFDVRAFQKSPHEPYLRDQKNIEFVPSLQKMDPFAVSQDLSKIILVEVSRNTGGIFHPVTAHFYTVVSYKNGLLTLHDPLVNGRVFEFQVREYFADGYPTYQLVPIDKQNYFFGHPVSNLRLMINGYVSIQIN